MAEPTFTLLTPAILYSISKSSHQDIRTITVGMCAVTATYKRYFGIVQQQ